MINKSGLVVSYHVQISRHMASLLEVDGKQMSVDVVHSVDDVRANLLYRERCVFESLGELPNLLFTEETQAVKPTDGGTPFNLM